ncbi:hypothetical protein [Aegicerativicinus sediminis]|uniref:hypothetical protein n=1 Tax=Aegicerativicinus sediminis TaxID=2893202 RepID=UPI001E57D2E2|nr:hypothetical protein [Aegicerativicinus sediminis]
MIENRLIELDSFIPWSGNLRLVKIYAVSNYFLEVVLDFETRKIESISSFNSIEYLEKYPEISDLFTSRIYNLGLY